MVSKNVVRTLRFRVRRTTIVKESIVNDND